MPLSGFDPAIVVKPSRCSLTVSINSSHGAMMSHPGVVVDLIKAAAR